MGLEKGYEFLFFIYLCLKDERKIPLTPINKPITISEIETEASDLAKFLNIKLENL